MTNWKPGRRKGRWPLALTLIPLLACNLIPTATAPAPTDTPSGPCQAEAISSLTIFSRPDFAAQVFSSLSAGSSLTIEARTQDGWLGFDPAVAQAANIGPFRLRWIDPGSVSLSGDCEGLPVVWGPPAGICFDMPMDSVEVHADPDLASPVLATLLVEQFAAVLGRTADGWAQVDLGPGNTGLTVTGWIESLTLNMNGPCDSLPILTP